MSRHRARRDRAAFERSLAEGTERVRQCEAKEEALVNLVADWEPIEHRELAGLLGWPQQDVLDCVACLAARGILVEDGDFVRLG